MAWSDQLKLNKQLIRSVTDAGYLAPKEVQAITLNRIYGGQDLIVSGPEGCGKTTSYILGVLMRLKYGIEEAPRALILVPDKESVIAVTGQFSLLNKNPGIRVLGLYTTPGMEAQLNALADGADIVVSTPDRARAIYLKLGLNLNKIIMFIVDDADLMVKKGLQLPINELANSIIKCQHLVYTEVMHAKLELMIEAFMNEPAIIEIDELAEPVAKICNQLLYHVPNFKTKLNLLNLLLTDAVKGHSLIFVNSRLTAEKIYSHLRTHFKGVVALLSPMFFESEGFSSLEDFKNQSTIKVLVVANELKATFDLTQLQTIIHFELPDEKETYIHRMVIDDDFEDETFEAITFATDLELSDVKKIENTTGVKMQLAELPPALVIAKDTAGLKTVKSASKVKKDEPERGAAFHAKKESNNKDYNFSASKKAKMNKKKKH